MLENYFKDWILMLAKKIWITVYNLQNIAHQATYHIQQSEYFTSWAKDSF